MINLCMKKKLSLGLVVVSVALFTECSKKESMVTNTCENEAQKVTNAANAFVANPTKANCEAYKKSINEALKTVQPTTPVSASRHLRILIIHLVTNK